MRILLVEDDEAMAAVVTDFLTKQHYVMDVANDGQSGWDLIEAYTYDLILLDVMLPNIDGITLCRRIRSRGYKMPVLLLTARQNSIDKVMGLDVGADDYVVKPFDLKELGARIRALLRRGNSALTPVLQWGKLHLDPSTCEVTYNNRILNLSPKEYSLLELFLRNSRRVFSRSAILDHLWSWENPPGEDTVKAHIKGLRHKFKAVGAPTDLIETVYGMGYRLQPLSNEEQQQNKPHLVAAGLPDEIISWLQKRLNLPIQIVRNSEETLDELHRGNWSLLLLDRSCLNQTVAKVLENAFPRLKQGKQSIVYCLERNLNYYLPKKLLGEIIFYPLDWEELATVAAENTGLQVPNHSEPENLPRISRSSNAIQLEKPENLSRAEVEINELKSERISSLQAAVGGLWEKFKDKIVHRLKALDKASAALIAGELSEELKKEAIQEAHKLAGSLGTFGFAEGSSIARQIEELLLFGSRENFSQTELKNEIDAAEIAKFDRETAPAQAEAKEGETITASSPVTQLADLVAALHQQLNTNPNAKTSTSSVSLTANTSPKLFTSQQSRLLIVEEDTELAQRLVMEAVSWGMHADSINNLSAARVIVQNTRPDLVVLDLSFSNSSEDGLVLVKELSDQNPPVPTVVLTWRDSFTDRVEVARMGACAFLRKPMQPSQVIEAVNQVLQQNFNPKFKILAVDDDQQILATLETLLQPYGFKLLTLNDSLKLWEVLETTAPDLLVLDVDMPNINGIELCRVIRNDPKWNSLPVLFLSSHTDIETIQQVFGVGADDYLNKPIEGPQLVTRIFNRLQRIQVLRSIAERDLLTGVANRRKCTQDMERLLRMANRYKQNLCFAILDLDYFKEINDVHGHPCGDKVLQRFGKILLQNFRSEDVVGRWGGEEFAICMYGITKSVALRRLNELLEAFRQEEFDGKDGKKFRLSFSAGLVEYSQDGSDWPSLYRHADLALYEAKLNGRARIREFQSP